MSRCDTMKRILITALLIALVPAAGAVAGYNDSGNRSGDAHIMSGSGASAGASTGVTEGENGSRILWRAEVAQTGASCASGNASGLADVNWSTAPAGDGSDAQEERWDVVSFSGTVTTATPCHTVDHEVIDRDNGTFVLNVTTERSDGACVECVGAVTYDASFEAPGDYRLSVMHDGDLVEVMESPGYDEEEDGDGLLDVLVSLLTGWL